MILFASTEARTPRARFYHQTHLDKDRKSDIYNCFQITSAALSSKLKNDYFHPPR